MIVYDFEVFKYDWLVCWLDTETRKMHFIVNDKAKFEKMYDYYKDTIWIGYNNRGYDQFIAKAILCDFNPYEVSDFIINKNKKGHEFSNLFNKIKMYNYDTSVGFRSLKELEAFMGHDITETSVPFDIDRKLTRKEILMTLEYCKTDVMEAFTIFVETENEFTSHIGLLTEFSLPFHYINKTKAQLSAEILGATPVKRDDEFDITIQDNIDLGRYEYIKDHFINWAKNSKQYTDIALTTTIANITHKLGVGGIHGAINKYVSATDGDYIMADVESYYPAAMIEYDLLSRNVGNQGRIKYRTIRDERLIMKSNKDKREKPRKIVLNGTFGASKDKYNKLYDPLQANNICINNQLFLIDLIDKLEDKCTLIQSNTDGILVKLDGRATEQEVIAICNDWSKRTRFKLGFDKYKRVFQRDVNNYILVDENGYLKQKGASCKHRTIIDNNLPILEMGIVNYFTKNISPRDTVYSCNELIKFQKVVKVSSLYDYAVYENFLKQGNIYINANKEIYGEKMHYKIYRVFASTDKSQGSLYKKHKSSDGISVDKVAGVPNHCFIDNSDITDKELPKNLDKEYYVNLIQEEINNFFYAI